MNLALQQVSKLQNLDMRILELKREVAQLPKQIAEIEKQLDAHAKKLDAEKAMLAANQRERKQKELDIQTAQQKISKLKDQMLQAKNNEQYRAFQHEIDYAQNEIGSAETRILELMEESEPLDKNVKQAEVALAAERKQVEAQKQQAKTQTAADEKEISDRAGEMRQLLTEMPAGLKQTCERIRKKHNSPHVLAEVVDGRCTACRIALRPQHYQDLKVREDVFFCESCGRILYYNPPTQVAMS
ncbi:MAG: hypothetical protein K2X03_24400 [Bryobacteraceae bacterium]|nr:hypothetical protein [Bryobacteraceae bacterium]